MCNKVVTGFTGKGCITCTVVWQIFSGKIISDDHEFHIKVKNVLIQIQGFKSVSGSPG